MIEWLLWLLTAVSLYLIARVLLDAAPLLLRVRIQAERPWLVWRKATDRVS